MTERNPKSNSPKAILADLAFEESSFPKHTDDFDEVSRFLEEHASFSFNLGDFDVIWQEYLEHSTLFIGFVLVIYPSLCYNKKK